MKYISTRANAPTLSFTDAVLAGLASDGGLYVPASLPRFAASEIAGWAQLSYQELAHRIMLPFVGDDLTSAQLRDIIEKSYSGFRHPAIAPLTQYTTRCCMPRDGP